jgi:hypothetical protein
MSQQQPDLKSVKMAARSQFGDVPGVQGFGIGNGTLRVYVRNSDVSRQIPETYQGVPVEFVITGDVEAYAPVASAHPKY